jgi:poly-beta-1,6-N-acetyl-D-glucosamine synthase
MRTVFWLSALFVGYVYVGYPALLALWAQVRSRSANASVEGGAKASAARLEPGVSIIIAARNEAPRVRARLHNLLALDYPSDRRQIIVVSDGSTDDTATAAASVDGPIDVISIPASGKAAALNAGVAYASHEILVFADARQRFAPDALRALVAPLSDAHIGGVSGELVLDSEGDGRETRVESRVSNVESPVADGVGTYWRFEKWLRRKESAVGSTLGVTGAIYALRRSLWRPLPSNTILDDVLAPMRAVLAGRRVVFSDRAKAFDHAARSSQAESRRKVRTLAGNIQLLWLEPRLLVPFVNPVWLQFCSHKLGRLAVPYALVALMASSMALAGQHLFYAAVLAAQCVFYLLAGYGAVLELRSAVHLRPVAPVRPVPARHSWRATERPRKGVVNA